MCSTARSSRSGTSCFAPPPLCRPVPVAACRGHRRYRPQEHRYCGALALAARDRRQPGRTGSRRRRHPSSPSISCSRTPTAIRRRRWRASLGRGLDASDLTALADTLPDGDKRLAPPCRNTAAVLGFVLDPATRGSIPAPPIIARGQVQLSRRLARRRRRRSAPGTDRRGARARARSRCWATRTASFAASRCWSRLTDGCIRASRWSAFAFSPARRTTSSMARPRPSRSPTCAFRWRTTPCCGCRPMPRTRAQRLDRFGRGHHIRPLRSGRAREIRRHDRRLGAGARRPSRDIVRSLHALGAGPRRCLPAVDARLCAPSAGLRRAPSSSPAC